MTALADITQDPFSGVFGSARGPVRDETLIAARKGKISRSEYIYLIDLIQAEDFERPLEILRASNNVPQSERDADISSGLEAMLVVALADEEPYTHAICKAMGKATGTSDFARAVNHIHEKLLDRIRKALRDESTPIYDINSDWVALQAEKNLPPIVAEYLHFQPQILTRWMSQIPGAVDRDGLDLPALAKAMLPTGFATNWDESKHHDNDMERRARNYCHRAHGVEKEAFVHLIVRHGESEYNG